MKVLKFFLVMLISLIIGLALFSWTNLWVNSKNIGIFYKDVEQEPLLVSSKKFDFNWYWQRIIPNKSVLLKIPNSSRKTESLISIYLPSSQYYGRIINAQEEVFKAEINIIVQYSINQDTLAEYIQSYYKKAIPTNGNLVNEQLDFAIYKQLISTINTTFPDKKDWTTVSFNNEVELLLNPVLSQLEDKLPIIIEDSTIESLKTPDFELYSRLIQLSNNLSIPPKTENADLGNYLRQYIFFVEALGKVIDSTPPALEVIKLLPPSELRKAIEQ